MTIHELLQAAGLTANDEIPIWDVDGTGEPTKKITAQQLATAVVALANLVTGVKGNAEANYRHGNVNLTPANIGAMPSSGGVMDGPLAVTGNMESGAIIRGGNRNTTAQSQAGARSSAGGDIFLYSDGTSGNRGLWANNANNVGKNIISINQNNEAVFFGRVDGLTKSQASGSSFSFDLPLNHYAIGVIGNNGVCSFWHAGNAIVAYGLNASFQMTYSGDTVTITGSNVCMGVIII